MKRIIAVMCLMAFVLAGCGEANNEDSEATAMPGEGKQYVETVNALLPDERLFSEDGQFLANNLQTNQQGEPALYQLLLDGDVDGEPYAAIVEYSLNSDGNWQTREFCKKELIKRIEKETEYIMDFPYIERGDDGNLYVLVKTGDSEAIFGGAPLGNTKEEAHCEYSVFAVDEANNTFQEVKLQTEVTTDEGEEIDYAKEFDLTAFHVKEDGTFFLVFNGSSAMWFDGATGTQTNLCPTIPDSAFVKNVAFGESHILYHSTSKGLFGILDSDTLTVSSYFGEEIDKDNRKYEWYFDTDTTMWQTYAFNQSGLYRISDFSKKASATLISAIGNFDNLAGATLYDILVGANEELYILLRRMPEDSKSYEDSWEFSLVKYEPQ